MARATNRLTATGVAKMKCRGRFADGGGLWLNVSHTSSKSWVYRWTPKGGRPREMGLGPYPAVSLADVRKKATLCREQVAAGLDPKAERDKEVGQTFGAAADAYLEAMASRWTNDKTRWQWRTTLTDRCAPIRSRPIVEIDTADVLSILNPIWNRIPETAARTRMRMEAVIDYAKAQGWRGGENPARWKGHLENTLPKRQVLTRGHHPAMAIAELPAFWDRLKAADALSARALQLLILTASRSIEVLQATWDEFDFDNALWTIPAERMKAKRGHRIPLTDEVMALLKPLHEVRVSQYVFPGQVRGKPLSAMSMEMLLRRLKVHDATVHGFRSTFRDWCGDCTSFPREVAEQALAHVVADATERAYRRGDALEKRRLLMQAWAEYCSGGVHGGKVVRLSR